MSTADVLRATPAPKAAAPVFRLGYRPGLDGLRGLAIIAVVADHTRQFSNRWAFIGVDAFFVLSGFLITTLLLEEWERFDAISLKSFYLRRALRLLPALIACLLVIVLYAWLVSPAAAPSVTIDAVVALFYCTNWSFALGFREMSDFGHTWSLSIEEQFYILWPPALILLLRRSASRQSILYLVLLGIFLVAAARVFLVTTGAASCRVQCGTDTRCDALLIGCAIAIAFSAGIFPRSVAARRWLRTAAYAATAGLAYLSCHGFDADVELDVMYLVIPLLAAVVMLEALVAERGPFHWVLSWGWLVYLGRISYGLYVWHMPIFFIVQAQNWPLAAELSVELSVTAVIVLASYYLLERPLLRLKSRFSRLPNAAASGKPAAGSDERRTSLGWSVPTTQ
jgi:peptidoglycan/LPS O-acetylase OafA/YrhL